MHDLSVYAGRPFAFSQRYIRQRPFSHTVILAAVVGAVLCSVSTQYGVKLLVEALSATEFTSSQDVWHALSVLVALIVADNLLWRLASWVGSWTFVGVTGDLRRDLFEHVTGHAQGFFSSKSPSALTSRVTATSNAMFTAENMLVWNVLPPCLAAAASVALVSTVSTAMAAVLSAVGGAGVIGLFWLAGAGKPLHHNFAAKAAAVDADMADVVGNISVVKSFGGLALEHRRFEQTLEREMSARRASLFYLERVRSLHAAVTVVLAFVLLCWAIALWERNEATTGDVVLVCTLGMSVLNATRDLAIALVDITQHVARLSEALQTLLVRHELRDAPTARPLQRQGASVTFEDVTFAYPSSPTLFRNLNLSIAAGERVALVGSSGGGKSTLFALLQRFEEVDHGTIRFDGQDIRHVTQQSLREAIAVVPQDVSLFQRSVMENIRYGRPGATDEEVRAAAEAAQCAQFIEDLPSGYHTYVGNRGFRLSGGERQRIAIARAFLKDAPLLLLDEATSALDPQSEEAIRQALARLMKGRTVIAIAHRPSTILGFDRVVVLHRGSIVREGRPEEVLGLDPRRDDGSAASSGHGLTQRDSLREPVPLSGLPARA